MVNLLTRSFHGLEQAMRSEGFRHPDGRRTIFHLLYTLKTPPPEIRQICVPLDPDGNSSAPGIQTFTGKPVVTTKPGDRLIVHGKQEQVLAVEVYRERYDVQPEDDPNSPQWKPKPLPADGYCGWC